MDDLKLYPASDKQLDTLLQTEQRLTKEINMLFGLEKNMPNPP